MEKVEGIVAPNGQLWKKPKTSRVKRGKSVQQKRRAETLKWRAKRKAELWMDGIVRDLWGVRCGLCEGWIFVLGDCELDHKIPVRRGGDTDENTHLTHTFGNRAKASVSLEKYLKLPIEVRRKNCGVL